MRNRPGTAAPNGWRAWMRIENDVNHIPTPLAFSDMLYTLRSHIDLVRDTVARRTATGA